jgi:hypothetical protein
MTNEDSLYGNPGAEDVVTGAPPSRETVHEPPLRTSSTQPDSADPNRCAGCGDDIPVHRTRCTECLESAERVSPCDDRPGQLARELALAAAAGDPDPRTVDHAGHHSAQDSADGALAATSVTTKQRYFDRVVITVVHAGSEYFARPYARAALDRRAGRWQPPKERREDSYMTIGNAEDADDLVDSEWKPLPVVTKATSSLGTHLLEQARERTIWDEDVKENDLLAKRIEQETVTEPIIYGPGGVGICSRVDLDALLNGDLQPAPDDAHQLWIVPALVFRFEHEADGDYERELSCGRCNQETDHVFLDHERSHPEVQTVVPVWKCTACGLFRNGPEPGRED